MRNQLITLAFGSALTLAVSGVAFAQDSAPQTAPQTAPDAGPQGQPGQGRMRMDPDRQLQHMSRELSLNSDQQSQIRPLLVDRQQKMEALFQDQSLSAKDRHARMQSIREESRGKIETVLNDQQKQKFDSMQERSGRGRGMQGGSPQGAQPQPQ
jgi:hypothetical protein